MRKHQIFFVLSFILTGTHLSVAISKQELKLLSVKLKLHGTLHPNQHCGAICSTPELSHGRFKATYVSWSFLALFNILR